MSHAPRVHTRWLALVRVSDGQLLWAAGCGICLHVRGASARPLLRPQRLTQSCQDTGESWWCRQRRVLPSVCAVDRHSPQAVPRRDSRGQPRGGGSGWGSFDGEQGWRGLGLGSANCSMPATSGLVPGPACTVSRKLGTPVLSCGPGGADDAREVVVTAALAADLQAQPHSGARAPAAHLMLGHVSGLSCGETVGWTQPGGALRRPEVWPGPVRLGSAVLRGRAPCRTSGTPAVPSPSSRQERRGGEPLQVRCGGGEGTLRGRQGPQAAQAPQDHPDHPAAEGVQGLVRSVLQALQEGTGGRREGRGQHCLSVAQAPLDIGMWGPSAGGQTICARGTEPCRGYQGVAGLPEPPCVVSTHSCHCVQ